MKRLSVVVIAAAMAIGFSAFTLTSHKLPTLYYKAGPNNFPVFTGTPCPIEDDAQCISIEPSIQQAVPVHTAQNDNAKLLARF